MLNRLYFSVEDRETGEKACEALANERGRIGYYDLPDMNPAAVLELASAVPDEVDTIALIGIGGSALGARAVYDFLRPVTPLRRRLLFFESTDPVNLASLLDGIDPRRTRFLVISKSGTTIETIAIYKYIRSKYPDPGLYVFVTGPGSPLELHARSISSPALHLPENVGGRFSVLSAVGLLPLALCGIDILGLLAGALKVRDSFFGGGYMRGILSEKALYYARHHAAFPVNCLFAYSESLGSFCEWYVQLWGESLGKRQRHSASHVGMTPVGLTGPRDQHSFLQLIMDGRRDKTVTFVKIGDFGDSIAIPDGTLPHLESLDVLNGLSFERLINLQCDSVMESLLESGDIPVDQIVLPSSDAFSMGSLIFYYELLTSLTAELIDVDAYDQPGVESGKTILGAKLRNGGSL